MREPDIDPLRRAVSVSLASLVALGSPLATTAEAGETRQTGARTLVAYFSRTGNTRVVAGLIHRTLGTDLFEIRAARAYPADYLDTVEQARGERDRGDEPALAARVSRLASYDTVFLGFPIWGETAPPIIRSFLSAHDLADKTLIPFVTHGGFGLGNSPSVLARHAPRARLQTGFSMPADQERQTMERVTGWLKQTTE